MSWTDERVELLKKLWADGLSASQIAAELGGITRNAVIGKVHRLGLSGRAKSPSSAAPRPRKARTVRPHAAGVAAADARQHRARPTTTTSSRSRSCSRIIPIEQRKTLLQLTEQTCRWPIGDPGSADFFFCGGAVGDRACPIAPITRASPTSRRNDRRRDKRPFRG